MTTQEQLEQRVRAAQKLAFSASVAYAVWESLNKSAATDRGPVDNYSAFFEPIRASLVTKMVLDAAAAFDTDTRTASIRNTISELREYGFRSNIEHDVVQSAADRLAELEPKLDPLRTLRNQRIAHEDLDPQDFKFLHTDLQEILEGLNEMANQLAAAVGVSTYEWEPSTREADRHTKALMRRLSGQ